MWRDRASATAHSGNLYRCTSSVTASCCRALKISKKTSSFTILDTRRARRPRRTHGGPGGPDGSSDNKHVVETTQQCWDSKESPEFALGCRGPGLVFGPGGLDIINVGGLGSLRGPRIHSERANCTGAVTSTRHPHRNANAVRMSWLGKLNGLK